MKEGQKGNAHFGASSNETQSARRDFLKKAAYAAPKLMVLGAMAKTPVFGASTTDERMGPGGGFGGGSSPYGG